MWVWLQDFSSKWGDVAGILDLAQGLVGLAMTLGSLFYARSAAEHAREAAQAARDSITANQALGDLSAAIAIMEEIKRLHRHRLWIVLPERYSELRSRLVAIRALHGQIDAGQRQTLQAIIEYFKSLERKVEAALSAGNAPANDPAKLNDVVSGHIDEARAVLLVLQTGSRLPS